MSPTSDHLSQIIDRLALALAVNRQQAERLLTSVAAEINAHVEIRSSAAPDRDRLILDIIRQAASVPEDWPEHWVEISLPKDWGELSPGPAGPHELPSAPATIEPQRYSGYGGFNYSTHGRGEGKDS